MSGEHSKEKFAALGESAQEEPRVAQGFDLGPEDKETLKGDWKLPDKKKLPKWTPYVIGVGALVLVIVIVVIIAVVTGGKKTSSPSGVASGVAQSTQQSSSKEITGALPNGQWAEITLDNGETYFGHLSYFDELEGYLLWDVYYPANLSEAEADTTSLKKLGTELHGPSPYMVIVTQSLAAWQDLAEDSGVVQAITSAEGYTPFTMPSLDEVKKSEGSAIFLRDGSLVFGKVSLNGSFVGVTDVYYLSRKDSDADPNTPIKSLDDLQLVPRASEGVGRTGTLWLSVDDVLLYENLATTSKVLEAMSSAQ